MHIQNGPFVINSNLIQKLLLASFFRISQLKITLYSEVGRWPAMSRKAEKNMWLHHKLTFLLLVWYIPNLLWDAKFEAPSFKAQLTLLLLDVRRQISMRLDSSVSRVSSTRVPNRISHRCISDSIQHHQRCDLRLFMRGVKEVTKNSMNW